MDCLGGTHTNVALVSAEQDLNHLNSRMAAFDRLQTQLPDTSIPLYGDSITEGMDVRQIGPNVVGMGVNGSTMRDFFTRANRSLINGNPISRHCAGAIFELGVNDTEYEYYYGAPQDPPYLYDLAALWMTGKWVIVKILPINEARYWPNGPMCPALTNARIDAVNAHVQSVFGSLSNFAVVDAKSALIDGTGQLAAANTVDGLHLSAAGYAIVCPLIRAALVSLGITP